MRFTSRVKVLYETIIYLKRANYSFRVMDGKSLKFARILITSYEENGIPLDQDGIDAEIK